MATISSFALRIPASLMEDVEALAIRDAVSVNQFLMQAAVEKVAALKRGTTWPNVQPVRRLATLGVSWRRPGLRLPFPATSSPEVGQTHKAEGLLGRPEYITFK